MATIDTPLFRGVQDKHTVSWTVITAIKTIHVTGRRPEGLFSPACSVRSKHVSESFKKCSKLRTSKYVVCALSWLTLCSPIMGARLIPTQAATKFDNYKCILL